MSEEQINEEVNEFVSQLIDEEKKNSKTLQCKHCKGSILKPGFGTVVNKNVFIYSFSISMNNLIDQYKR